MDRRNLMLVPNFSLYDGSQAQYSMQQYCLLHDYHDDRVQRQTQNLEAQYAGIDFSHGQNLEDDPEFQTEMNRVADYNEEPEGASISLLAVDANAQGQNLLPDSINTDTEDNLISHLFPNGNFSQEFVLSQESLGLSGDLENLAAEYDTTNRNGALLSVDLEPYGPADYENTLIGNGPVGNENICFENYMGQYGFQVLPVRCGKTAWSHELNKFYCDTGTFDFNFKLDYESINRVDKFKIRMALVFTEAPHQAKPVTKCINCTETQKKILDESSSTEILHYVVRGQIEDKNVTYFRSEETKFRYLLIALRQPELGSKILPQKLIFTCRSSCKSDEDKGINRRPTALIFTLLNELNEVCGRSVINLRICSAPNRDSKNELGARNGKKRRQAMEIEGLVGAEEAAPKRTNFVEKTEPVASTSSNIPPSTSDEDFNKSSPLFQSSQEFSSQETVISLPEELQENDKSHTKLKLRKLAKDSKKVMKWLHSDNWVQQNAAMQLFECLRYAQSVCEKTKGTIQLAHDKMNQ